MRTSSPVGHPRASTRTPLIDLPRWARRRRGPAQVETGLRPATSNFPRVYEHADRRAAYPRSELLIMCPVLIYTVLEGSVNVGIMESSFAGRVVSYTLKMSPYFTLSVSPFPAMQHSANEVNVFPQFQRPNKSYMLGVFFSSDECGWSPWVRQIISFRAIAKFLLQQSGVKMKKKIFLVFLNKNIEFILHSVMKCRKSVFKLIIRFQFVGSTLFGQVIWAVFSGAVEMILGKDGSSLL